MESDQHRRFSEISRNWSGRPLDNYDTILNYLRRTTTQKGLIVKASLVEKEYMTGIRVSDKQMKQLCIVKDRALPR